jgi:uroporphyrinogen decarboxylase
MNSLERIQAVLAGRIPDRVPVCLHNFLMAAREAGVPMEEYRVNPEAIARAHLLAYEKYGPDCILIDLDTTMLAEAMGAQSACAPDEPGRIVKPVIQNLEEVGRLRVIDPEKDGRIPALLEAVRILASRVGHEVAIRGNADQGAFSLACLVRGIEDFLMELTTQEENSAVGRLLDICYQSHLAVHRALVRAGAHFTSLGDSLGGPSVISPTMFDRYVRPYEERLVRELAAEGIFTVIHICGDTTRILGSLSEYDACGFELDYKTDADRAKATVGRNHVLFGNIDPSGVIGRGTPAEVREATERLISSWKPGARFVLNAGCALPPTTPPENVHMLVQTARKVGRYD